MIFQNRQDAGSKLAEKLIQFTKKEPIILAIPRGGVLVAKEIAERLNAPLDVIIPRKIGAQINPELAIGAVTQDGIILLNQPLVERFNITNEEILEQAELVIGEINRRLKSYRGTENMPAIKGRSIILVDDGIATGLTIQAALMSIKNQHPREVILATPVATPEILERLKSEVDQAFSLITPDDFYAVGQFYQDFEQVTDEEVINIIRNYQQKSTHL